MLTQELSDHTEMRRRLLITAIALARFRQQTGAFPESLQSMIPTYLTEVPLDLYSGLLPIYVKSPEDGYLLYSIGADGIDSGGRMRTKEVNSDDIAVRVPQAHKK